MLDIRVVLHPHDFSATPSAALEVACVLARDYKAELILAHVVEPAFTYNVDGAPYPIPSGLTDGVLDRLKSIQLAAPPAAVRHVVAVGFPVEEILRVAAESKADLIVLGTHGRTGLARLAMGSVAEGVLRQAVCPVVAVRNLPPDPLPDAVLHPGQGTP